MNPRAWSWIGACSVGSSHLRAGTGCEDAGACLELKNAQSSALLVIVSDGAGSARYGSIGSKLVVRSFAESFHEYFDRGGSVSAIEEALVSEWLDEIRDRVGAVAGACSAVPRDFAATLLAAIVDDEQAVICHVGDGACVVKRREATDWEVPSWPTHGEYASSTYFVTDDPAPNLKVSRVGARIDHVAAFSDGLERLALNFSEHSAYKNFFDPMLAVLNGAPPGRHRALSSRLRVFLDSPQVIDRTDDDKTFVLASRSGT